MITRVLFSIVAAGIVWYLGRAVGAVVPMESHLFATVPPVSKIALWVLPVVVLVASIALSTSAGVQRWRTLGVAMLVSGLLVAVVPIAAQWSGMAAIATLTALSVLAILLVVYGIIALRCPQAFVMR